MIGAVVWKSAAASITAALLLVSQSLVCADEGVLDPSAYHEENGYHKIAKKLYPDSKLIFYHYDAATEIYYTVYELEPFKKYYFVPGESNMTKVEFTKNGKPIKVEDIVTPRKIKVYAATVVQPGNRLEVDKEKVLEGWHGYTMVLEPEDRITLAVQFKPQVRRELNGAYTPGEGWKFHIERTNKPDNK